MKGIRKATGDGIAGWCAVTRRPAVNADPALDLGLSVRETAPFLGSCLAVPLVNGDQFAAGLGLYGSGRSAFTEDDLRLLELLAPRVAASLNAVIDAEYVLAPAPAPLLKLIRTGAR